MTAQRSGGGLVRREFLLIAIGLLLPAVIFVSLGVRAVSELSDKLLASTSGWLSRSPQESARRSTGRSGTSGRYSRAPFRLNRPASGFTSRCSGLPSSRRCSSWAARGR
jgi:hypothetical protein